MGGGGIFSRGWVSQFFFWTLMMVIFGNSSPLKENASTLKPSGCKISTFYPSTCAYCFPSYLLHHCMTLNYTGSVTDECGLHMIHVYTNSVPDEYDILVLLQHTFRVQYIHWNDIRKGNWSITYYHDYGSIGWNELAQPDHRIQYISSPWPMKQWNGTSVAAI